MEPAVTPAVVNTDIVDPDLITAGVLGVWTTEEEWPSRWRYLLAVCGWTGGVALTSPCLTGSQLSVRGRVTTPAVLSGDTVARVMLTVPVPPVLTTEHRTRN